MFRFAVSDPPTHELERRQALALLPPGFAALSGARKVDALLGVPDPGALIRALPTDELYLVLHDIGLTDATDLLALASVEQRRGFIDLACWAGDTLDTESVEDWLDLLREASMDVAVETVGNLDPELVAAHLLSRVVAVVDRSEEDKIEAWDTVSDPVNSLDQQFVLFVQPGDDEAASSARRLMDLLYRWDQDYARDILRAAQIGLRIENEELAYRFRTARLADLGIPGPEDAYAVFARVDIAALRAQLEAQDPPPPPPEEELRLGWALARVGALGATFLHRCLAGIRDRDRFVVGLADCTNSAFVASGPGLRLADTERLARVAQEVWTTLSLGLEVLSEGSVERGIQLLDRSWLLQIHQAGHQAAVNLAVRARRLQERAGTLLEPEIAGLVDGLVAGPRPRVEGRLIGSNSELEAVGGRLASAEATCDTFDSLGVTRKRFEAYRFAGADAAYVRFDTLARTLVAHVAAGHPPGFDPLDRGTVGSLVRRGDAIDAARSLRAALDPLDPAEPVDPRFLLGVVVMEGQAE